MEKTYEHTAPSVKAVNGWIYAEAELRIEEAKLVTDVASAELFEKQKAKVSYTGRMRAVVVSDEAQKALGLKPGMYFYPNRYTPLSPVEDSGSQYLSRTFLSEGEYKRLKSSGVVVPPTCDIHYESVAYVCR